MDAGYFPTSYNPVCDDVSARFYPLMSTSARMDSCVIARHGPVLST